MTTDYERLVTALGPHDHTRVSFNDLYLLGLTDEDVWYGRDIGFLLSVDDAPMPKAEPETEEWRQARLNRKAWHVRIEGAPVRILFTADVMTALRLLYPQGHPPFLSKLPSGRAELTLGGNTGPLGYREVFQGDDPVEAFHRLAFAAVDEGLKRLDEAMKIVSVFRQMTRVTELPLAPTSETP